MVVDGKLWFFGLNSRGDQIITPLIDDRFVMVGFAIRYMRLLYGDWASKYFLTASERSLYWHEVIDRAIDKTEPNHIASEPFSTVDFRQIATSLKQAAADDRPITGFTVRPDLLGLLAVARGYELPSGTSANASLMAKLGLSEFENDVRNGYLVVDMLAGRKPLKPGATYADAAAFLRGYIADMVNRAPGNWKTMFQDLVAA